LLKVKTEAVNSYPSIKPVLPTYYVLAPLRAAQSGPKSMLHFGVIHWGLVLQVSCFSFKQ